MICEYLKKILPLDGDNLSTAATTAAAATVTAAAAVVGGGFLGWWAEAQADPEMEVTEIILAKIYRFVSCWVTVEGFLLGYRFLNP